MKRIVRSGKCIFGCGLALSLLVPLAGARSGEITLYTFTGGNDGGNPPCGLISGGKGILPATLRFYGTTETGGSAGFGTVFKVETGFETVLHSFAGGSDGTVPEAAVVMDGSGNFYGTTKKGGTFGLGVVFKLTPGGSESALYSFTGGSDGSSPVASLIMDGAGNLYGTTEKGGASGLGVVFKVAPGGSESVLHPFAGSDGAYPVAGLIMDETGNLYGTTSAGGSSTNCSGGCGTVFRLAPDNTQTVLHSFSAGSDGSNPQAGVIMDKVHNLYGTTRDGGAHAKGTVFKLSHKGKEIVLHSFAGGSDGANPAGGVIKKRGFLYGTTFAGGAGDHGTVFKTPNIPGADTVLYAFGGASDGAHPKGGLVNVAGNLFGTTYAGGDPGCNMGEGCGVVFELTP